MRITESIRLLTIIILSAVHMTTTALVKVDNVPGKLGLIPVFLYLRSFGIVTPT